MNYQCRDCGHRWTTQSVQVTLPPCPRCRSTEASIASIEIPENPSQAPEEEIPVLEIESSEEVSQDESSEEITSTLDTDENLEASPPNTEEKATRSGWVCTNSRNFLYDCLDEAIEDWKDEQEWWHILLLMLPIGLALGAIGGFGFMWGAYWGLEIVGGILGNWTNYVLYYLPYLIVALWLVLRDMRSEQLIRFKVTNGTFSGLIVGKFEYLFSIGGPMIYLMVVGGLIGLQTGLLFFLRDHAGLPIEGTFQECLIYTLDNMCHGIFLDTFEIYDIRLANKIEYGFWTGTIFYVFRLCFDLIGILIVFNGYQRIRMWSFFRDVPEDFHTLPRLSGWLLSRGKEKSHWPRLFFDEAMFLMISAEYLAGNYDRVRWLGSTFPRLAIDDEVREMFVAPDGEALLPPRLVDEKKPNRDSSSTEEPKES